MNKVVCCCRITGMLREALIFSLLAICNFLPWFIWARVLYCGNTYQGSWYT